MARTQMISTVALAAVGLALGACALPVRTVTAPASTVTVMCTCPPNVTVSASCRPGASTPVVSIPPPPTPLHPTPRTPASTITASTAIRLGVGHTTTVHIGENNPSIGFSWSVGDPGDKAIVGSDVQTAATSRPCTGCSQPAELVLRGLARGTTSVRVDQYLRDGLNQRPEPSQVYTVIVE